MTFRTIKFDVFAVFHRLKISSYNYVVLCVYNVLNLQSIHLHEIVKYLDQPVVYHWKENLRS